MRMDNGTRPGWKSRLITLSLLLVLAGTGFASTSRGAVSQLQDPSGPDRFSVTTVQYTKYFWWMLRWGTNVLVCEFETDHEGFPTPNDIFTGCGEDVYDDWITQQPCRERDTRLCQGHYIVQVGSEPATREVSTLLPPPLVEVTLENCSPVYTSSTSICEAEPILVLTGIEPLPDHHITRIEGIYEGQSFACDAVCRLRLPLTSETGTTLQFWAVSSYGDTSEIFNALFRVAVTDGGNPDQSYWYVDVLSSQWAGVPVASCVEAWQALPPIGGPPRWLSTPTASEELGTDVPYNYLAANLIRRGQVDVSACPDGGLLADGTASTCGMEQARSAVNAWQNQFDAIILNIGRDTGVPAHLLKNLFARESQFWPGTSLKNDVGLGQLTAHGADTTLLWNPPFFRQFCPLVMDSTECSKGYLGLEKDQQEYVRHALISAVTATCENCPLGVDLERANFSIGVFAHTLLANCEQAGQLVENVTGGTAGNAASYEDLWRFTLVNYNAGPGCLGDALDLTFAQSLPLTWQNVSAQLSPGCVDAARYVDEISR